MLNRQNLWHGMNGFVLLNALVSNEKTTSSGFKITSKVKVDETLT